MEEFVIPSEQRDLLFNTAARIYKLFHVQVLIQNESDNQQWIKISSLQGKTTDVKTAKDYITALCCPDITEIIPYPSHPVINIDDIARNYGVLAVAIDGERSISLKGSQFNVALAKSLLENEASEISYDADVSDAMESCKSFARKLGYSNDDIELVAKALWPGPVDTNTFLEELLRRKRSERHRRRDVVPRGIATRSTPISHHQQREIIEVPRYRNSQVQADSGCHGDLCPIIIDGSNVAMHHGNHRTFSCRGIALCVDWFQKRGHQEVFALVPRYRADPLHPGSLVEDQQLLLDMADKGVVQFTPSKHVKDGRVLVCYDDRFIIELADQLDGVIVSNDGYRDLVHEKTSWKYIIEKRVLMFSFVRDLFMVPDDPLGRTGPNLTDFLRKGTNIQHTKICPWIGNCTFGPKCKFYHPEKERKSEKQSCDEVNWKVSNEDYTLYENRQREQLQQQQYNQQADRKLDQQQHYQFYHSQQQPEQQRQHHQHNPLYQPHFQQNQCLQHDYYHPLSPHHQQSRPYEYPVQQTIYTVPTQYYSYPPPNSQGYNNSGSMNDEEKTLYNKLIEMFPNEKERITTLMKDKPEIQDISILVGYLLQDP